MTETTIQVYVPLNGDVDIEVEKFLTENGIVPAPVAIVWTAPFDVPGAAGDVNVRFRCADEQIIRDIERNASVVVLDA